MNAILGYATLLEDLVQGEKATRFLQAIQKAGNNLVNLISDILDLSKIEAGKLELQPELTDIRNLIAEISEIFELKVEEKKIALDIFIDERIPDLVKLDEIRTKQVLFNLIGNAVKFTKKGSIHLKLTGTFSQQVKGAIHLRFEVRDTGIGIDEEHQKAIFEPFLQSPGQSTKRYGGTGLGLSISRRLVEMMGGSISVASKPGEGSTFFVTIPDVEGKINPKGRHQEEHGSRANPAELLKEDRTDRPVGPQERRGPQEEVSRRHQEARRTKILVVDDVYENIEIAGSILEANQFEVYGVSSGTEALEILETQSFDLILLDMMMEDMDGIEVCTRIKSNRKNTGIPVIFLTAKADTVSVVRGLTCGAVDYIRKPFNPMEFVARIRTHVELKKVREELENIATVDTVTKLANRREILRRIEYETNRFERWEIPFSVMLAEVNGYHQMEADYSRDFMNGLLSGSAELLKLNTRKLDIPARWAEDRFLILLPECDAAGAEQIADRLRKALHHLVLDRQGKAIPLSMDFGVGVYQEKTDIRHVLAMAEENLKKAKEKM